MIICLMIDGLTISYSYQILEIFNRFIRPIYRTLTETTTSGPNGFKRNNNEEELNIFQSPGIGPSPSNTDYFYTSSAEDAIF